MKIAQVCPFFYPVEGGVEKHVLNISTRLAGRGHEVHVFTSASSRDSRRLQGNERMDDLRIHRFDPIGSLGEFGSLWPGFAPEILDGGYDVVHAHSFRHPHSDISAFAAKLARSRSVLTSHSPFHPAEVRMPLARGLVPVYDTLVAPLTLRVFDRLISVTASEANMLIGLGAPERRVYVIPNGVEDIHFEHVETTDFLAKYNLEGKKLILYLGRINRTKGVEGLVRAFAEVAKDVPEAHLVVAGPATSPQESEYDSFLRSLVSSLGEMGRVTFTGRLSEGEKLAAFESCRLFVLPSLYEPFGIVLLEAAAHGKAILASRTDGPSNIITPGVNGLLVSPGNVPELRQAMYSLLTDDASLERISRGARDMAVNYRWDNIVARIERLYEEIRPAS